MVVLCVSVCAELFEMREGLGGGRRVVGEGEKKVDGVGGWTMYVRLVG